MKNLVFQTRFGQFGTKLAVAALVVSLLAAAGCSSDKKESPPAAAVPAQAGAGSNTPVAATPGSPSISQPGARPAGTFNPQEVSAGGSAAGLALGQALFSRPDTKRPYGYAARGGSSGSSSSYYPSGSGMRYYPAGSGMRSGSAGALPNSTRPFQGTGTGLIINGGAFAAATASSNPSDTRLAELEQRAAALEQRVQALVPAVRQATESSK